MIRVDIAIVGAGMAGASLAAELSPHASVLLIEAEAQPGHHATGRSAAFWTETYGGPAVQPLTSASFDHLAAGGFLHPRGALHIAERGREDRLAAFAEQFQGSGVRLVPLDTAALRQRAPMLRDHWTAAIEEASCTDIDVAALHAYYLKRARGAGVQLRLGSPVAGIERKDARWQVSAGGETISAEHLVNAAGAWAGEVAALAGASPIAIAPLRRTMLQLEVDPPVPPDMPLLLDVDERFYVKPEAGGRLWLTPHDETPVAAHDVQPDELDLAVAIDRLERATRWQVLRLERSWAGLRSFTPDRAPVYGADARAPGFFWFAGQGGFGIQTAPAAAMIGAALLLGHALPSAVAQIDVARYSPDRFV